MRQLTLSEINILQTNGCEAQDWGKISVHPNFDPNHLHTVSFIGDCYLGDNSGGRPYPDAPEYIEPYHIRNARLVHCHVGDRVIIESVRDAIAHYDIGDNVEIRDVAAIKTRGASTFGNGTEVAVLNETGGREVLITDHLSAHTAYLMAMYRHDTELLAQLLHLSQQYADSVKSSRGSIGEGAIIKHCGQICNVKIGPYAVLNGASELEEGSINSTEQSPVEIGSNVVARKFIFASGSQILDGVNMDHCYVGQGCHFAHLFSAHDSLFFANCQGENGEACAIFAGPYTVSMHKSSLLIAGYFSFLNAGSGSNQSNHLYKLGPIHQGIVERGSKTTSDSYVLWPARIGAFSLVMGRHVDHIDSSDFPFSYLIENDNKTFLVPGANLRTVGTIRDSGKWPKRDRRHPDDRIDNINFDLLTPYTIGKMYKGWCKLRQLEETLGSSGDTYVYHDMRIRHSSLRKGCDYYSKGITKFLGGALMRRINALAPQSVSDLLARLAPELPCDPCDWVDLAGIIAPYCEVARILQEIKEGKLDSLTAINEALRALHERYYDLEWSWAYNLLLKWYGVSPEEIDYNFIVRVIEEWRDKTLALAEMVLEDGRKEFNLLSEVGFGIDFSGQDIDKKHRDFEVVRGSYESNPFIQEVRDYIQRKGHLTETLLATLRGLSK